MDEVTEEEQKYVEVGPYIQECADMIEDSMIGQNQ
jgi:hypothetical protein